MTDTPTRRERYGRAAVAGQLRIVENRTTDLDTIAAAGMAGVREPLGLAMWRAKYANDKRGYNLAKAALRAKAVNTGKRRRWPESEQTLRGIADRALWWAIFGICPPCTGRGHLSFGTVDPSGGGRQVLADEQCPQCHGTGRTPIDRIALLGELERTRDIVQLLADADDAADARMRRALAP